jgi:hypothetical protein
VRAHQEGSASRLTYIIDGKLIPKVAKLVLHGKRIILPEVIILAGSATGGGGGGGGWQ